MDAPAEDPQAESIGDLFGRLAEDGRAYVQAELGLYKEIALHRAGKARTAVIALVAGGVLLFCAAIALLFGLVLGLATLIGPLLAGLAVAAVLAVAGYVLIRTGAAGMRALQGGPEEAEALKRGERP